MCPAPFSGNSGGQAVSSDYIADTVVQGGVVQNNTGCNELITFSGNGAISTIMPNAAMSYDAGLDDNLVGIINNTSSPITSITFTSSLDIFGFDGDGICGGPGYNFVEGPACVNIMDPNGYGGPYVTYSNINSGATMGTVNFGNGGIAPGGSAWFSLEGPVSLTTVVTPEPATVMLLGFGGVALGLWRRRRSS